MPVATSFILPGQNGQSVARYLNFTEQPIRLSARSTIDTFTGAKENQGMVCYWEQIIKKAWLTVLKLEVEKSRGSCRRYVMQLKAAAWNHKSQRG